MDEGIRRSIFVTGAASGIGRAACVLFAERGWFVGASDVDQAGLQSLVVELGGEEACHAVVLNTARAADVLSAISNFGQRAGQRLDVVFANAGVSGLGGAFDDIPLSNHQAVVDVNVNGVVNTCYAAIPLLKTTPNSLCFSTSSSSAIHGVPNLAVYAASKGFVRMLTESLSVELAPFDSRASDVLPGIIETPLLPEGWAQNAPKKGPWRVMPASAVAETVWDAYHSSGLGRIHWYVPAELEVYEKQVATNRETARDKRVEMERKQLARAQSTSRAKL